MAEARRPRRPIFLDPVAMEEHGGTVDPVAQLEAAHASAQVLVGVGRAVEDPEVTDRFVGLVEEVGLDTIADLWAQCPARSLPGALWRLYALREWVRRDARRASREYAAGLRHADVDRVVAGAAEPPGPLELTELLDAILTGVFRGDLRVALQRAAAFCRVVSAGRGETGEDEHELGLAAGLHDTARDLDAAAVLWGSGDLI